MVIKRLSNGISGGDFIDVIRMKIYGCIRLC